MINEKKAKDIVVADYGEDRKISLYKETSRAFIFMCESLDKNVIPSKIVVAVNKESGKTGASIFSEEAAVKGCM